ncbi:hypothetical protein EMIT048CA2_310045 [Pseudomonas chlororaphis]|uniref:hypothetical protein n=1 Tax=Pseudomonas chlororaphis TaxID=587753 RepID=UPI0039E04C12
MQPHQYALSAGIALLFLLAALPYLFGIARRRAFDQGKEIGLAEHDAAHFTRVRDLCADLDEIAVQREAEQRKHLITIANLKRNIVELEERIMSYTGLAVTRTDYENLVSTVETLLLAERTLHALKSQPYAKRAAEQAQALDNLAKRIHSQLRATPARAATAGKAA